MVMTETLAFTGLGMFMGFMVLCMVLLIWQGHRKHQHVLRQWHDLAHRHHWTFVHHNKNPRWEIRSSTWQVNHQTSSHEGFPDRVVLQAPLQKSQLPGVVVATPKWKRWQKTLQSPHPTLKTRDLTALGVPQLEGLLSGLQQRHGIPENLQPHFMVLGQGATPAVLQVLAQHVQAWPRSIQPQKHLHVLLDHNGLTLQVDEMEFAPEHVLPLIHLAEQMLDSMQKP